MKSHALSTIAVIGAIVASAVPGAVNAEPSAMTFFVTSVGSGKGADYGGIAGADKHCQTLAAAAGGGARTWHAYLSTQGADAINARDRIGKGPWQNAKGVVIARTLDELHGGNNLNHETALSETGQYINGRLDGPPLKHDILTGTRHDGTAFPPGEDRTCGNWTKSGEGSAMLGHHDRMGISDSEGTRSWNSSHPSRGCGDAGLASTGGGGLLYCFAVD